MAQLDSDIRIQQAVLQELWWHAQLGGARIGLQLPSVTCLATYSGLNTVSVAIGETERRNINENIDRL